MGCHTWFKIPVAQGKDECLTLARKFLEKYGKDYSSSTIKMYEYAIKEALFSPVMELAAAYLDAYSSPDDDELEHWIIYQDPFHHQLAMYNAANGTEFDKYDDREEVEKLGIISYSNEPRIGGYPERVVRSYEDMLDFMSTGFDKIDEHTGENKHFDFYYDAERYSRFMGEIEQFFIRHPEGIITFG